MITFDIEHGFKFRAHDLVGLFQGTNKISTFMNKVEKQSTLDELRYDSNKYKGDAFEFLIEILLKSHAYDNRIGITNYTPVQSNDNGVDGYGNNLSGHKCVVQIKYRSDNKYNLTANEDKIGNLLTDGMLQHGVSLDSKLLEDVKNKKIAPLHYLFTTASGLHHYTNDEFLKGVVHCVGYEQLRSLLDNNLSFWNLCREISKKLTNSINQK